MDMRGKPCFGFPRMNSEVQFQELSQRFHTVDWYRGVKAHRATVVGRRHGKTLGLLLKRYSIFTLFLRLLYDFPPPRLSYSLASRRALPEQPNS
jgi:hypothetical protein